jgi:hypothetical protein
MAVESQGEAMLRLKTARASARNQVPFRMDYPDQ